MCSGMHTEKQMAAVETTVFKRDEPWSVDIAGGLSTRSRITHDKSITPLTQVGLAMPA